jgi:hypothetical protein
MYYYCNVHKVTEKKHENSEGIPGIPAEILTKYLMRVWNITSVYKTEITAVGIRHADHLALSKLN